MSSLKCQVFLRNLSERTSAKQIQQYASRFGPVLDCYLTKNADEAFIEFNDRTSVDIFMEKRPHSIDGHVLHCQRCLPPNELQKSVKRLFLRGTMQQLTDNRLTNYFDKYGKVLSCTIPKGNRNNIFTHFGYAFVTFDDEDIVDKIIQDKPHYVDDMELEVQKAEDLTRSRRHSSSRSPSTHSSRSLGHAISTNNKRARHETPSPQRTIIKRTMRQPDEVIIRQLEEENRRLREHIVMIKQHSDENAWKLRRELEDERRRYDQLKVEYDHLRRDFARVTYELEQKISTRHVNSTNKRDLSSKY